MTLPLAQYSTTATPSTDEATESEEEETQIKKTPSNDTGKEPSTDPSKDPSKDPNKEPSEEMVDFSTIESQRMTKLWSQYQSNPQLTLSQLQRLELYQHATQELNVSLELAAPLVEHLSEDVLSMDLVNLPISEIP